jgi:NTE family protein
MSAERIDATRGLFDILEGPALERLERETVSRGTTLIAEGSSADEMYLIETGRFTVERDGVNLAEIGAGSVIGEIAFLTGSARTADVIAARSSVVLRIDRRAYDLLCSTTPGLQQAIASELAGRLAETSARVVPDPGRPKARTVCLVPSAGAPLPARFAPDLAASMGKAQSVRLISEAEFQAALGDSADPESDEAMTWLNAQERTANTVLFVAGAEADAWSRAVLHQADHVVFVAQAHRPAPPSEIETLALELIPESQRRLVLIHPHRMQHAKGTSHWLTTRPCLPAPPCGPDRGWRRHRAACPLPHGARHRNGAVGRRRLRCGPCGRLAGASGPWRSHRHRGRYIRGGRHVRRHRAWASRQKTSGPGSRRSSSAPVRCGA